MDFFSAARYAYLTLKYVGITIQKYMFCLLKLKKNTLKNLSRLIFVTSNPDSTTVVIQSAIRTLVTLLSERRNSM